jgi:hypothetical protein
MKKFLNIHSFILYTFIVLVFLASYALIGCNAKPINYDIANQEDTLKTIAPTQTKVVIETLIQSGEIDYGLHKITIADSIQVLVCKTAHGASIIQIK